MTMTPQNTTTSAHMDDVGMAHPTAHHAVHFSQNHLANVTHAGEVLEKEFLAYYDLSVTTLAKRIGVDATRLYEIIAGRRSITPDTALRLGKYFGTTPQYWLTLQMSYDILKAKIAKADDIIQIVPHDSYTNT